MSERRPFVDVLRPYLERSLYTDRQLSTLTGIPRETVKNWREGRVRRARDWRDLARLARALHLSEAEVSELFASCGHPAPAVLMLRSQDEWERGLLASWVAGARMPVDPAALAAARKRLAQLPQDLIPTPAPLPSGSRMPHPRNPLFVGREADLRRLAQAVSADVTTDTSQTALASITGMAGLGKTQLVAEFVHRYGQFFAGGVFWLSFADPQTVRIEVAACGGADCMALRPDFGGLGLDEQVQLVRAAWQSPLPRLLIFDNCEDEELLAHWRPRTGGCVVMLTSRRPAWDPAFGVHPVPIDVLERGASIALLRNHRRDLTAGDRHLHAICRELGDLPLALHLAGTYLLRYQHVISPATYLVRLHDAAILGHPSLNSGGYSPTGHLQHVARTFALSYDRLDSTDHVDVIACDLLARAAYFAPGEPIPRTLLLAALGEGGAIADTTLASEDALSRLVSLGLLQLDTVGALRMHRLISMFVQRRTATDARDAVERALVEWADQCNAQGDVHEVLPYQNHLRHITDRAMARDDERAAALCSALGYHLWMVGDYDRARPYLERALAIRRQKAYGDDPAVADNLELLALLFQMQGNLDQAQPLFEQGLRIRETQLGLEHPATADAYNNLGYLLLVQARYDEAYRFLSHALLIRRRLFGLRHIEVARVLNNLGYLFLNQGKYRAARRYLKLALAVRRQVLPEQHVSTAQTLSNLGEVLLAEGDSNGAWIYHQQAYTMRRAIFGEMHHDTGESLLKLGRVLHAQGDLPEARSRVEGALEIIMATFGSEHRVTAEVLEALGSVLCAQGDYTKAGAVFEQALAILQRRGEEKHPIMATILHSFGLLRRSQDRDVEARAYLGRALEICRTGLGANHPKTSAIRADVTALE